MCPPTKATRDFEIRELILLILRATVCPFLEEATHPRCDEGYPEWARAEPQNGGRVASYHSEVT